MMLFSWQHFREILLETFILVFCSPKISDVFVKVKNYIGYISEMNGRIHSTGSGSASVGCQANHMTLTFNQIYDIDLGFFIVKFRNSCILRIVGLIDVKRKGC